MPHVGELNNSTAGLGSPGPSGVDLSCNKAVCTSDLVPIHFDSMLYEADAHFHLSLTLVMVQ